MDDVPHYAKTKALLKAIGVEVKWSPLSWPGRLLQLVSMKTRHEMRLVVNGYYRPIYWDCYRSLWQDLVNSKMLVGSVREEFAIDNPYYGCKSAEEAFVRKDLMGREMECDEQ